MLLNIRKIITICNDKICFEQREIDLAAQNPCRMLGWSYSKVVIPIADFHAPFFLFLFSLRLAAKRKSRQIIADLSALYRIDVPLHRCIVDFSKGVDGVLFQAVNYMEVSLRHLY